MTQPRDTFVVGMGASAGGLETFQEFFDAMPADSGLAFVLVQHLHPHHESLMPELLAKHTDMPVFAAEEDMEITANQVYVIPANTTLTVSRGKLHLEEPSESRGHRMPIDHFFKSLSEDFGEKSICVILSGTGADGTLGLKAVKEQGGLAVAQKPENAKYEAMPYNAIDTGLVDMVLDVREMPQKIINYKEKLNFLKEEIEEDDDIEEHLDIIFTELEAQTSNEFDGYKRNTILRRIRRRMQILQLDSLQAYAERIKDDRDEVRLLSKDLLIGVTHFFRDTEAFTYLQEKIIPELLKKKRDSDESEGLRIWVPGCATGEEAYTLAMIIREEAAKIRMSLPVQIFATDIDGKALTLARQAVYPEGIEDQVPGKFLDSYFAKQGSHYHLDKGIRDMCIISPHNLISDPPYSRIDLITCRNLLIYFDSELQRKILPIFHYSLKSKGYLFLGPSENISARSELFRVISKEHKIFQARENVPPTMPEFITGRRMKKLSRAVLKSPAGEKQEVEDGLAKAFERRVLEKYVPFSAVVNDNGDILYWAGQQAKYLDIPRGVPRHNLLEIVHKSLRLSLRNGLHKVISTGKEVEQNDVLIQTSDGLQRLKINLSPFNEPSESNGLFFVVIREIGLPRSDVGTQTADAHDSGEEVNRQLEEELQDTREYLQATIEELETSNEELKSSNEELLSMNQELHSSNEELQTSQEELQSTNEELETVNSELKKKVQQLDVANSDLQNLYESSNIATVFLDGKLRIKAFTPASTNLFHLVEADISRPIDHIKTRFNDIDLKQEADEVLASLDRRYREITQNETGKHYIMQMRPYRTVNGVIDGVTVSFVDVTELKAAKHDLEIREQVLGLVTDAAPALIAYVDRDFRYKYCNAAYFEWFGLKKDEVQGRKIEQVLGKESYVKIRPHLDKALAGESVHFVDTLSFRYDAKRIVNVRYEPHINQDGEVCGVIVYAQDESERIKHERELSRLAAIMKSTHEAIISTNDGIITDWNEGAEQLYGYTNSEAVGQHVSLIVPEGNQEELDSAYERLRQGESLAPFETIRRTKAEEQKHVLLSLALIKNEKDEFLGISGVAHDISERVLVEKKLAEVNMKLEKRVEERTDLLHRLTVRFISLEQRERRRFSEYLHDEIQQSVAAARLLLEQIHGEADEENIAPPLSEALRLLSEVIANTRTITMDMSPPLFFETGISICLQWLTRWASAKLKLQVEAEVTGGDRPVAEEAGYLLYRSLRELLFNIHRHAGVKEAKLQAAFKADGALEVLVSDEGSGFDLEKVVSAGANHFGVLSILEQVKGMTGTMNIDSAEGQGTRIRILLPGEVTTTGQGVAAEELVPAVTLLSEENQQKIQLGDGKKVVLIVDDQEDLRFTLRLMLEELSQDYVFLEAEEAWQAIEIVKQYRPPLVLMDVSMPGMSGVEATKKIKAESSETVVIGLSMHEREDMEEAMREAGAACYLTKDSPAEEILAAIGECLNAEKESD